MNTHKETQTVEEIVGVQTWRIFKEDPLNVYISQRQFTEAITTLQSYTAERERVVREAQGKRYITLMNKALGDAKLPESVWKKIARVNQLILDK